MGCSAYSLEAMIQNLKDVGCDDETVEQFIELQTQCKLNEQLFLLAKIRKELLRKLHISQERLDSLDYLIYKIQKKQCDKKEES